MFAHACGMLTHVFTCEGQDILNDFSTLFFETLMEPNLCVMSEHSGQWDSYYVCLAIISLLHHVTLCPMSPALLLGYILSVSTYCIPGFRAYDQWRNRMGGGLRDGEDGEERIVTDPRQQWVPNITIFTESFFINEIRNTFSKMTNVFIVWYLSKSLLNILIKPKPGPYVHVLGSVMVHVRTAELIPWRGLHPAFH